MLKKFIYNALNSWVTSSAGIIVGLPQMWEGIKGVFDNDDGTGFVFKTFITGLGIFIGLMMTRDHTKNWTDNLVKAPS